MKTLHHPSLLALLFEALQMELRPLLKALPPAEQDLEALMILPLPGFAPRNGILTVTPSTVTPREGSGHGTA
jgi:hypothetical protein